MMSREYFERQERKRDNKRKKTYEGCRRVSKDKMTDIPDRRLGEIKVGGTKKASKE
jgi:hypothetical protein